MVDKKIVVLKKSSLKSKTITRMILYSIFHLGVQTFLSENLYQCTKMMS